MAAALSPQAGAAGEEKFQFVIKGGHETDPRDRGRPVALVAGALGVTPDVFRSAFRQVKPAAAGKRPEPEQVRRNKSVLLGALAPHGVTNDELDRVSDYYRYNPGRGEMWPVQGAAGYAVFKDGALTSVTITNAGSGFNSLPTATIPGHTELTLKVKLAFDRDFKKNGSIASIQPAPADREAR